MTGGRPASPTHSISARRAPDQEKKPRRSSIAIAAAAAVTTEPAMSVSADVAVQAIDEGGRISRRWKGTPSQLPHCWGH